jgi:DNA-binding response OmpR family regulator
MAELKKAKILVVDDEEHIVKAVKYILESEGYSVDAAVDGEQALAQVEKFGPDLILLDVMMPKKNGYDVCRELKEENKTQLIPIIIVTALKQKEERIKGIEAGADDFISKPIDQKELLTRIKSLLRIKFLNDELKENYQKLQDLEDYKLKLTSLVVHDMKNIITGSMANLSFLAKDARTFSKEQKEFLGGAQASDNDLLNMILNLLDISKMEENKLKINCRDFKLVDIVKSSIMAQEPLAKPDNKRISLEMSLPDNTILCADKALVERVFLNLLNNSIRYSNRDKDIFVKLRQDTAKNCVEVCIESNGHFIPKEYHKKIFEKFGQLEVHGAGQWLSKGLGLTFSKMAIEAHNGEIWFESDLSGHNKFFFTLPLGVKAVKEVKI